MEKIGDASSFARTKAYGKNSHISKDSHIVQDSQIAKLLRTATLPNSQIAITGGSFPK